MYSFIPGCTLICNAYATMTNSFESYIWAPTSPGMTYAVTLREDTGEGMAKETIR